MIDSHIRFDWAMKRILRDKANFGILEGFLSELLGEDIKVESILESESNPQFPEDKYNRVDILAKDAKGALFIVEVQLTAEVDYFLRILYGVSKAVTEYMQKSDPYPKIRKVVSISILYTDLDVGQDYVYKGETEFIGLHLKDQLKLSERQKIHFQQETPQSLMPVYYLINVNKFKNEPKDGLDEWVYFFRNSEIKKEFHAKGLQEAAEKLRVANLNEKERKEYERQARFMSDKASRALSDWWDEAGYPAALREEGKKETQKKTAINAILMGFDNDTIIKLTELSVDEIEKLRRE